MLQGLVICGRCGNTMTVRYHVRAGRLTPDDVCQKAAVEETKKICQWISGGSVDEAVGQLEIDSVLLDTQSHRLRYDLLKRRFQALVVSSL